MQYVVLIWIQVEKQLLQWTAMEYVWSPMSPATIIASTWLWKWRMGRPGKVVDLDNNIFLYHIRLSCWVSEKGHSDITEPSDYYYIDVVSRCRWSSNSGEPTVFIKYDLNKLNILDIEKKALILKSPVCLEVFNGIIFSNLYSVEIFLHSTSIRSLHKLDRCLFRQWKFTRIRWRWRNYPDLR